MGVSDNSNVTARKVVAHEYHNSRPEYRTWKSWVFSDKTPGCYDTEDLTAARLQLLQHNISPGVSYRAGEICALHIPIYRQHIYKTPQFAMSLLRWSDELNYNGYDAPYRGESLASYTHQVVLALVKTGAEKVSSAERFKILSSFNHRCSNCGDKGDAFNNQLELDHPTPLRAGGDNEQPLVPLCSACHSHKSYLECLTPFQENPLASVFEQSVYDSFHLSPKPKQSIQQLHQPPTMHRSK